MDDFVKLEALSNYLCRECLDPFYAMPRDGQAWYCSHTKNLLLWSDRSEPHGSVFSNVTAEEAHGMAQEGKQWRATFN